MLLREILLDSDSQLVAWSSVSGTYAVPDGYLDQAALPLELFWTFFAFPLWFYYLINKARLP